MATIEESEIGLEQALGEALEAFLPQTAGYSIIVEIHESGRKKRRNASRDGWRPGSGEIRIRFGVAVTRPHSENPVETNQPNLSSSDTLNPQHPQVVAVLGQQEIYATGFQPADIDGEPLSATVLCERR